MNASANCMCEWPSSGCVGDLCVGRPAPAACPACQHAALTEQGANDRWTVSCGHCATFADHADADHATVEQARAAWECEVALYSEWVAAGGLIDVGPSTPLVAPGGVS